MERLKTIKEQLVSQVQTQMGDLKRVDAKELGEVVDMIKDLSEAMYYCEIYKQMEESAKSQQEGQGSNNYYYTERYYPDPMYYRDMDRSNGRMYYSGGGNGSSGGNSGSSSGSNSSSSSNGGSGNTSYYTEMDYPITLHDEREGRSPQKRKMYMESKATH